MLNVGTCFMHGFGQRLKDLESISLPSEFTWEPHKDDDPKRHLCFQRKNHV